MVKAHDSAVDTYGEDQSRPPHAARVVAVIAPWNVPLILAMRSVAPAMATGNAVILKPASETVVCCGVVIARRPARSG